MRQFRPSWHRHWRLVGVGLVLTGLTCIGLLRSGDSQQEEEEETVRGRRLFHLPEEGRDVSIQPGEDSQSMLVKSNIWELSKLSSLSIGSSTEGRSLRSGESTAVCSSKPLEQEDQDPLFPKKIFTMEQLRRGAVALHVIGVLYMFYSLALVCDHYFVPTIYLITDKMKISPDVAGATFMAAAESAPELFTSLIGVFIAISEVGVGTIVGSAVFNVLFVIGACALASTKLIHLAAWPLTRDTFFYAVSLALLVVCYMDNKIYWWEDLILIAWYAIYVLMMKFNIGIEARFYRLFPSLLPPDSTIQDEARSMPAIELKLVLDVPETGTAPTAPEQGTIERNGSVRFKENLVEEVVLPAPSTAGEEDKEEFQDVILSGPQGGLLEKLSWFLGLPVMLLMWVTIPDPNNPARQTWLWVPSSFLMSVVWIAGYTYLMVWWATVIGEVAGVDDTIMGLTFLAAGTSVPDLISSIIVTRQGQGDMAVSSCIGSNIFDITICLPFPWLLYCAVNGEPYIKQYAIGMSCNIIALIGMLIIMFLSILLFRWKLSKPLGGFMLLLYAGFVAFSITISTCLLSCPL